MGKSLGSDKNGLKKGPWTAEEDQKLVDHILKNGHGKWRTLPKNAGLKRCGKSCRLRWTNYLRPDIKRGKFSVEEEETIIQLHKVLGNKWSAIAAHLAGRTDNEIKNYWNTHIKKKLLRMGIDPVTHSPRLDLLELSSFLSSTLCNSSQVNASNFLGLGPFLNPDILNLATTLLSCQNRAQEFSPQNVQGNLNQIQSFQQNPLHCPDQSCTKPGSDSSAQFLNEHQLLQANLEQISQDPTNFNWQIRSLPNLSQDNAECFHLPNGSIQIPNYGYNYCYSNSQADRIDALPQNQAILSNINGGHTPNMRFGSLLSTPSSSSTPLNSSSTTYVNGSTEDERDSYCSNMFDSLDAIGLL